MSHLWHLKATAHRLGRPVPWPIASQEYFSGECLADDVSLLFCASVMCVETTPFCCRSWCNHSPPVFSACCSRPKSTQALAVGRDGDTAVNTAPSDDDAAWDASGAHGLREKFERFQARAEDNASEACRPLLHLEILSSDCDAKGSAEIPGSAPGLAGETANLSSQRERLAMYTSGAGFGVGNDSSTDVDDETYFNSTDGDSEEGADASPGLLFEYEDMNIADLGETGEGDALVFVRPLVRPSDDDVGFPPPTSEVTDTALDTDSGLTCPGAISDAGGDGGGGGDSYSRPEGSAGDPTGRSSALSGMRRAGSPPNQGGADTSESHPTASHVSLERGAPPSDARHTATTRGEEERALPAPKLHKIPPPPPEKLRRWEESARAGKQLPLSKAKLPST